MSEKGFLNMLQICDSVFPIGTFTLSNGLETAVKENRLTSAENLQGYLKSYISVIHYNELGVMRLAYENDNIAFIERLDNIWGAYRGAMETRRGSEKLCTRFIKVWEKIENIELLEEYKIAVQNKSCRGYHPIAVGIFARKMGVEWKTAAEIFGYSLLSAITANAVKSVPLSQLDGQRILNSVFEMLEAKIKAAENITIDEIGIGGTEFEIFAMRHEELYSRLYMS